MSTGFRELFVTRFEAPHTKWERRRDIPIAILAWTVLGLLVLWIAGHFLRTLFILGVAGLLAYALAPGVKLLQRVMPRILAILIIYCVVLGGIGLLLYFIISTATQQIASLSTYVGSVLAAGHPGEITPLERTLRPLHVSHDQFVALSSTIVSQVKQFSGSAIPMLTALLNGFFDAILIAVMSVYFLIDGSRGARWFRRNAPRHARAAFVLDTLQRVLGGYIRGQLVLCTGVGLLVGCVMSVFGVPYALLLGVISFVLEFIPVLGTIVSGALCVVFALTLGWPIALGVLISFVVIHIIEGHVMGPRVIGQALGLHPVISLAALVAGGEIFGVWGALVAAPLAGILQAIIIALWEQLRSMHPEQFEHAKKKPVRKMDDVLYDPLKHDEEEKDEKVEKKKQVGVLVGHGVN